MAFPTTSVLDTFSGTLGSWTTPTFGDSALTITGGAVTSSVAGYGSGVWTAAFGPDMEIYIDLPTVDSDDLALWLRVQDSSSSITGYGINWQGGSGTITVDRWIAGSAVTIDTGSQVLENADKVGASIIGTLLTVYYHGGSSWTEVLNVTNGAITGTGQIGLSFNANVWRGDNFGGGTYIPPAPPTATVAWFTA